MKIFKPRRDVLFTAGIGLVLAGVLFFLFFNEIIPNIFYAHWLFLILALIIFILPSSRKKFEASRRYSPAQLFSRILVLQISLFALHFGIFSKSYSSELIHYGLFPWAWVAILAAAFASTAYLKRENAFGHLLIAPLIKIKADSAFGVIINNSLRFCQSMGLSLTFALIILLIPNLFGVPVTASHFILPMLALFFVMLFSLTSLYNRFFSRISAFPALSIFLLIFAVGLLFTLLQAISIGAHLTLPFPALFHLIKQYPEETLSSIASLSWWMSISIIASLFIARISGGYSWRSLVAATLIFPALLTILLILFPSLTTFSLPDYCRSLIGIAGFISTMILILNKKMLSPFVLNYLPKNGASKFRNPEYLLRKLFQMTLIFLYLFLPLGLFISAGFVFAGLFPMLIFIILFSIISLAILCRLIFRVDS